MLDHRCEFLPVGNANGREREVTIPYPSLSIRPDFAQSDIAAISARNDTRTTRAVGSRLLRFSSRVGFMPQMLSGMERVKIVAEGP